MFRKFICLFILIVVLGTAGNTWAELVGYWRLDEGSGTGPDVQYWPGKISPG